MFGHNEIVGRKYFRQSPEANEGKFLVTSVFYTLQGEGPLRGEPAVFVRLAKCNLACSFCDTYFDSGDWMTPEQLQTAIFRAVDKEAIVEHPLKHVNLIFTGGEPSLQDLGVLCHCFDDMFAKIQIESNGTLYPKNLPDSTILVISPKCAEKDGKAIKYLRPSDDVLDRADCLKFVVEAPVNNISPYNEIPEWALEWRERTDLPIFVSPINVYNDEPRRSKQLRTSNKAITLEDRSSIDEVISFWEPGLLNMQANQANHEYAARLCMRYRLTLNLQLHLYTSLA